MILLFTIFLFSVLSEYHEDFKMNKSDVEFLDISRIESSQILIVESSPKIKSIGYLSGYNKINGKWINTFIKIQCNLGKNGISLKDDKIEGDGKTPSGIYYIGDAFGYLKSIESKMNFIILYDNHYWISDSKSKDYNTLVDYVPKSPSNEKMKRPDNLYKYGIIIEYNKSPVIKNKGSAIFIHIQRKNNSPTNGCISIPETKLIELIKWIDPKKNPQIIIGNYEVEKYLNENKF